MTFSLDAIYQYQRERERDRLVEEETKVANRIICGGTHIMQLLLFPHGKQYYNYYYYSSHEITKASFGFVVWPHFRCAHLETICFITSALNICI